MIGKTVCACETVEALANSDLRALRAATIWRLIEGPWSLGCLKPHLGFGLSAGSNPERMDMELMPCADLGWIWDVLIDVKTYPQIAEPTQQHANRSNAHETCAWLLADAGPSQATQIKWTTRRS